VAACHDLSDGGLAVALAESVLAGRVGARVLLPAGSMPAEPATALFSETPSRLLVATAQEDSAAFEALFAGVPCSRIGTTVPEQVLEVTTADGTSFAWTVDELAAAFRGSL
jgi:phosphoribosylformylglycinamidine synthase